MHKFDIRGVEIKYKIAGKGNATSSRINLPKSWEGKKVVIIRVEE